MPIVRVRGGLREHLRFFHTVDPAITRKRDVEGMALKSDARLRVVVDRAARRRRCAMYDITTGTGDFIANGVVSHNCFARPTHKYLDFDAGRDFEREIVVKVNVPEVLRAELARPSWKGEHVALGTNTDPYQWVEGRYRLMRGIWEALRDCAQPVLDPHEVAAAAARPRRCMREIAAVHRRQRVPLGADAGREGVAGDRAAHAAPARAAGGGGRAQPRGHPDRRPDRAADARDQRRARAGRADPRAARRRRGRPSIGGHRAAPARRGARGLHGLAALASGRTSSSATRSSIAPRRYAPRVERARLGALVRRARARSAGAFRRDPWRDHAARKPAPAAAGAPERPPPAPEVEQTTLF